MDIKTLQRFSNTFLKFAQESVDTPNISIQPGRAETNCALEILKAWDPNYFVGISEIVVSPSAQYGHVESGPDRDPTIIYLNADRIIAESNGDYQGKSAAIACASTIAHEKGHVDSFDPEQGFVGGETPAIAQEQAFEAWLNGGGMQIVEALPSYQALV